MNYTMNEHGDVQLSLLNSSPEAEGCIRGRAYSDPTESVLESQGEYFIMSKWTKDELIERNTELSFQIQRALRVNQEMRKRNGELFLALEEHAPEVAAEMAK